MEDWLEAKHALREIDGVANVKVNAADDAYVFTVFIYNSYVGYDVHGDIERQLKNEIEETVDLLSNNDIVREQLQDSPPHQKEITYEVSTNK